MVVVMVVTTAMRIITLVIVVMMMLVAMTMWVMTFAMFMMKIVIVVVMLFLDIAFYLLNPSSRGSDLVKIKEFGIKDFRERHIAIVTVNDLSFRLDSTKDSAYMLALFR